MLTAVVIGLAFAAGGMMLDPPEDGLSEPQLLIVQEGEAESAIDVTFTDYRCDEYPNCGPGPVYTQAGGALEISGCSSTGPTSCTGSCKWCTGAAGTTFSCKPAANHTCRYLGSPANLRACGQTASRTCTFAVTPPIGQFPTASNCYCTGGVGTPSGSCTAINCM